ncbi:hypothetical protein [Erythrobacter sp. SG61-1L]|uniref:hypothetical protein n=1 Tax=Erythrobacter sp. SG61-1L TaxID=1603897 RepID=UPI000AC58982|nr:hypothetical protein [Erythrobacter sp. SG61-1L]
MVPHTENNGGLVVHLDFEIAAEGYGLLSVADMGEGGLVLSQQNEAGKVEQVAVSREQLLAALASVAPRYADAKNTEPHGDCAMLDI